MINAILISRLCREIVLTRLIQVHNDRIEVLTRNFNIVHKPCIVIDNSITRCNLCFDTHLSALANNIIGCNRNLQRNASSVDHIDFNAIDDHTCSSCSSCIDVSSLSRHFISNFACSICRSRNIGDHRSRIIRNGSIVVGLCPSVLNVLIAETLEVSIQRHNSTRTNLIFRSIDLKVTTELLHREIDRSRDTITNCCTHCIHTRDSGGEDAVCSISGKVCTRAIPSISCTCCNTSSHPHSGVILTNHIVASHHNFRDSVDRHSLRGSNSVKHTLEVGALSSKQMRTYGIHRQRDGIQMLSRNLNAVEIPII